jgi:hypothetical protein
MKHPWQLPDGWQADAATYYNITSQSGPDWDAYVATNDAFYYNSLKVPTIAG